MSGGVGGGGGFCVANKPPPRELSSFSCHARIALINITPLGRGGLSLYQYMRDATLMEYLYILNLYDFFVVSEMKRRSFYRDQDTIACCSNTSVYMTKLVRITN